MSNNNQVSLMAICMNMSTQNGPVLPVMSPSACQSACQTCSFGLLLSFGWSSLDLISSFFTIINHLLTSTYKPLVRTVDPKVEGSSPSGLVM